MSTAARPPLPDRTGSAPVAWFWGDDAWSIDRAVTDFAARLAGGGDRLEVWRAPSGDDDAGDGEAGGVAKRRARVLEEAAARVGTATLFGGGTLVVIRQPAWIAREAAGQARLRALLDAVAPGNGLCFAELAGSDGKDPASTVGLREAVVAIDGTLVRFPAIGRERIGGWLEHRARELGCTLGPGAGALLAERIGATVRERDIDRRHQTELANAELEKLALYRPGGTIAKEDVAELVAEAIPGSTWAFLDALGTRRAGECAVLAERLLHEGTAIQALTAQIHRRLRELLIVRDLLDDGARPPEIVKATRLQPFRAEVLAGQAAAWTAGELEAAIDGLVELDLRSKGIDPGGATVPVSAERDALGLQRLIAERVVRRRAR